MGFLITKNARTSVGDSTVIETSGERGSVAQVAVHDYIKSNSRQWSLLIEFLKLTVFRKEEGRKIWK